MENISVYLDNITIITFIAVFAGGVITSFTPCVYPLVPIIIGVIGSSREQSKVRNFLLSLFYVLGMAVTFSVLGILAALTGRLFGQIQSNPVAHVVVGGIIIIFALALLDVVHLPVFLINRIGAGKVTSGGRVMSVFFMGVASGLVAAPCTTAIIGALLAYVASTQNVLLGFSLLFVFAIGVGTILIIVGTFTGILTSMPKSGRLMNVIQKAMAFALIALGCYFIFRGGVLSV